MYPVVLAGLMKVLPFHYPVCRTSSKAPSGATAASFWRYQPDFLIALFNQVLFSGGDRADFFLARKLFDTRVAWLSAILVLGSELFWRFSVSGLSTMLLMMIFLG